MASCEVFAPIFQTFAAIIWIATVILVIYYCYISYKLINFRKQTCYEWFFQILKYTFILISIPIPIEDVVNIKHECNLIFNDGRNIPKDYGSSIYDLVSNVLFMLQMIILLHLSFMKAHWIFRNTPSALSRCHIISIIVVNIVFWVSFFFVAAIATLDMVEIQISYIFYILIAILYIGMVIWAQWIFESKLMNLIQIDTKDSAIKAVIYLIDKHRLLIRLTIFAVFIDLIIGAIYIILEIETFFYLFNIAIFLNIIANLVCIILAEDTVKNVYDWIHGSKCGVMCDVCCLCRCCYCYRHISTSMDIDGQGTDQNNDNMAEMINLGSQSNPDTTNNNPND